MLELPSDSKELTAKFELDQSRIEISNQNNESFIKSIVDEKESIGEVHPEKVKKIQPIQIPSVQINKKATQKLKSILHQTKQRQRTTLGMLYAGFYSLRYNAQEFFGAKFGKRRNTPEK